MQEFKGRRFAALLFDMDGTLIDSVAVAERTWRAWAIRHGIAPDPLLAAMPGVRTVETVARWATPGMDVEAEAEAIMRAELDDLDGIVPVPGATAFLDSIPDGRWAIVTSASRVLAERRLAAAGIPTPPVLVSADDVDRGKPEPDCYLAAARKLGVAAAECLVFEDAPAGIAAGDGAGAATLVITATHEAPLDTPHAKRRDYLGMRARRHGDGVAIDGA